MPILNSQVVRNAVGDDYYVPKSANGNVSITGELYMTTDISNSTGLVHYGVSGVDYPLYPSGVKLCSAGTITKQTSATAVSESLFTIPLDGYYSFSAQINLDGVGTIAAEDSMTTYLDVSGGSLTPVAGTINITDIAENTSNSIRSSPSGIIQQKLTAGQQIQLYHLESATAGFTFSSGSIQVAYAYLGNKAL